MKVQLVEYPVLDGKPLSPIENSKRAAVFSGDNGHVNGEYIGELVFGYDRGGFIVRSTGGLGISERDKVVAEIEVPKRVVRQIINLARAFKRLSEAKSELARLISGSGLEQFLRNESMEEQLLRINHVRQVQGKDFFNKSWDQSRRNSSRTK